MCRFGEALGGVMMSALPGTPDIKPWTFVNYYQIRIVKLSACKRIRTAMRFSSVQIAGKVSSLSLLRNEYWSDT